MFFRKYFEKRKALVKQREFRTVRFAELPIDWTDGRHSVLSIIFYENDNGERKYIVSGLHSSHFPNTTFYAPCQTWKHTGLFPEWSKDPLAEKLSR